MHSERQEARKTHSQNVKELHDTAYAIMLRNGAWDARIYPIITKITELLDAAKAQSKQKLAEATAEGKKGKARKNAVCKERTKIIDDTYWTAEDGPLSEINKFCTHNRLINTLGMKLPDASPRDGSRFLTVAIMFLSKAKEVIMSGLLHAKAERAKQGIADPDECEFINTSYAAKNILSKLRGKDRYMHAIDKTRPDAMAITKCRHMIMELEKMRWMELTKDKKIPLPKHFQLAPPRPEHNGGKNHGKGSHDARKQEVELLLKLLGERDKTHNTGHRRPHPHHKKNADDAPPREESSRPGPMRVNPQRPPRSQAYMHGYYY